MIDLYRQYIDDVTNGKIVVCDLIKRAVDRHLADIKSSDKYFFSEAHASRALAFFSLLRHTKGAAAGKRFQMQPNQAFIIACLFGWLRKDNGKRRFRKAYIEVARKNGKSELAAGVLLYCMIVDGEKGSENYSAATTRDQAKIVFKSAKTMAEYLKKDSQNIAKSLKIWQHSITYEALDGTIQALSADASTLDGLNPHSAVIDEYHEHRNSNVLGVIQTGTGSREQPLVFVITTAGFNLASPCYTEERKVAIDVLNGHKKEDTLFTMIFTLDDGDQWDNPDVWIKANPNLGITPNIEYMEAALKEAKNKGGRYITQFLTKNLNVWTDAPEVWIPDDDWRKNDGKIDIESLKGRLCFGGLDLASVEDITSLCLFFPAESENERHVFLWYNWLPEDTVNRRSNKVNYPLWADQGHIRTTPGNVTDYEYILSEILDAKDMYQLHSVQIDRWNSLDVRVKLTEAGVQVDGFGQGFGSMSTPTKEFQRLILEGRCNTGADPVARWSVSNVVIDTSPAGDIKINKSKASEKVDPMTAAVMAVGGWLAWKSEEKPITSYLLDDEVQSAYL